LPAARRRGHHADEHTVGLEQVLALAIVEFGVEPLRDDWEQVSGEGADRSLVGAAVSRWLSAGTAVLRWGELPGSLAQTEQSPRAPIETPLTPTSPD